MGLLLKNGSLLNNNGALREKDVLIAEITRKEGTRI